MKIIYKRLWDIGDKENPKPIMTVDQDWVPAVGTSVYFPAGAEHHGKTFGTVADIEMHYPGGSDDAPYVEVWLK